MANPGNVLIDKIHKYWQAANFLSVGQIYLYDDPLLKKSLKLEHIYRGSWGIGEQLRDLTSYTYI